MDEIKALTFTASIAPLQSAIRIAHDGGARVSLDIPESEMSAIVRLVLYRGRAVKITIEEIEQNRTDDRESAQTQAKRRAARRPTDVAGR